MSKRIIVYGTSSEQALVQTIEELRRENAALRKENERLHKAGTDTWSELRQQIHRKDDQLDALREDTERLATAAEEVLCTYILTVRMETGHPCPENLVICRELRAAIDATRKEAQPWGNDPIMRRHLSEGGTPA